MEDSDHKSWVIEHLLRLIEREDERRKSLEAKAAYGATTSVALLGAIASIAGAKVEFGSLAWYAFLLGYLSAAATFVFAFLTIRTRTSGEVDYRQFVEEDATHGLDSRYDEIVDHLLKVMESVESFANSKGGHAFKAQVAAMIGALAFLFALAVGTLKG